MIALMFYLVGFGIGLVILGFVIAHFVRLIIVILAAIFGNNRGAKERDLPTLPTVDTKGCNDAF